MFCCSAPRDLDAKCDFIDSWTQDKGRCQKMHCVQKGSQEHCTGPIGKGVGRKPGSQCCRIETAHSILEQWLKAWVWTPPSPRPNTIQKRHWRPITIPVSWCWRWAIISPYRTSLHFTSMQERFVAMISKQAMNSMTLKTGRSYKIETKMYAPKCAP